MDNILHFAGFVMNEAASDLKTVHEIDFKPEDIVSAYVSKSGKANMCMCGCSGTYYYSKAHQAYASKNRGYKVTDEDTNDEKVLRVYNLMKKNEAAGIENLKDYIYTLILGKTQYTIYLKEK